jgi:hypothetical protein
MMSRQNVVSSGERRCRVRQRVQGSTHAERRRWRRTDSNEWA